MYQERLRTLTRAYSTARKNNAMYKEAVAKVDILLSQREYLYTLQEQLKDFNLRVTEEESLWRQAVLGVLEAEILEALAQVYPTDGYVVKLSTKVSRGKIHVISTVQSLFTDTIPGSIAGTQGRLFQQVVSFGALVGVMMLIGVKTIYEDEAFSGSSKKNIQKLNGLLQLLKDKGYNLIMIAQDKSMANGLEANRLFLERSTDNKTTVYREVSEDEDA